MDYTEFFTKTLTNLGLEVHGVWNAFDPVYDSELGWPLKLPVVDFKPNTLLVMHFQDFITLRDGKVLELEILERAYRDRASQILVTHMNHGLEQVYHGPIKLIEYSNHNCREMSRLQTRWSECESILSQPKTKHWQCLNGRMCQHRRRTADILQNWNNGWLSYGDQIPLPIWNYTTYCGTENDENFVRLLPVYGSAAVNIVTETQYDHRSGVICEKTLFAMAAGQVPVLIGYPGIVADCQDMGFDMFDDVVDISYDFLPNDQRVEQAILRNQDLIQGRVDLSHLQARLAAQSRRVLYHTEQYYRTNFVQRAESLFTAKI